jgi:hypothetical protein
MISRGPQQHVRVGPTPGPESGSDDYGGPEADGSRNYKPGSGWPEHDHWIVGRNKDVIRIDRLDFDVISNVRHCAVGIRERITVIVGALAEPLDSIHHIGSLTRAAVRSAAIFSQ